MEPRNPGLRFLTVKVLVRSRTEITGQISQEGRNGPQEKCCAYGEVWSKSHMSQPIASMDLGTNSFHLVVVQPDPEGGFEILSTEKESVRLGSGGGDLDLILPDAMDRGLAALKRFAAIARSMNAEIRAVATSAVREARNSGEFLDRVRRECEMEVEVIPGQEEARLIYLGVLQCLDVFDKRILCIDIGGGSTEYLVGKGGIPEFASSQKLGAIRLKDRFFPDGSVSAARIAECRQFIQIQLTGVREEVRARGFERAVGSSGTAETLFDMIRQRYNISDLKEPVIEKSKLDRITDEILGASSMEKRMKLPGLDEKRADIIVGGAILLQESFQMLGIESMIFSRFALREGVVFDTLQRRSWSGLKLPDVRRAGVERLARSFQKVSPVVESEHAVRTSLMLFDGLSALRPDLFSKEDRFLLESGARLHNVGMAISHNAHHKHGYYIIKNSDLLGFTPAEVETIAQIARYHRKGEPKQSHIEYAALSKKEQARIYNLTAILRIGIGLARIGDTIESIQVSMSGRKFQIRVFPRAGQDASIPLWAAQLKSSMLEKVLDAELEFQAP